MQGCANSVEPDQNAAVFRPASMDQLDAHPAGDQEVAGSTPVADNIR